jgi:4-amino-4-deoxy-L-arabinose transferase-like glycosyltransferase
LDCPGISPGYLLLIFLQDLGYPDITTWDEAIHVNVVENLADHCCLPQLHRSAAAASLGGVPNVTGFETEGYLQRRVRLGTDYRDWTNNTVWLHKPLLPFYVTAFAYRIGGHTLLAFRLPGAIFALLTALMIYLIGREFLSSRVGLFASAAFALNPYANQLVHGEAFAGFPDLALSFFVSAALYLLLHWRRYRSAAALRWLGLAVGLAYMCKGGLALAPFAVFAVIAILARSLRDFIPALQSVVLFVVVVLPEKLYWQAHQPVEFRYEAHVQMLHLVKVIEGFGGSWSSYFAGYLPPMLTLPLVPFAYFFHRMVFDAMPAC